MSRPRAVVFVGPTLYHTNVTPAQGVELRPPVRHGDLDALLASGPPDVVGLVDGAFFQTLGVPPKEVLRMLDRGVTVFGASSIGALRAVECGPFGMVGVGRVFEEYASGRLDADDEVAMTYDPDSGRPLSDPLVNLRFGIAAAVRDGVVSAEVADRFLAIGKALYFPQRSVSAVLAHLTHEVGPVACAAIRDFFALATPDVKRDDALELLTRVGAYLDDVADHRR